jgi:hypothetical protein
MFATDTSNSKRSLKEIRNEEAKKKEQELRDQCEKFAFERFGEDQVKQWSNKYKGLWYLPVFAEDGTTIDKFAVMKPIDRYILSHASTKIEDEGLYIFLEAAMRECFVDGDDIFEDEEIFLACAQKFNKIIETRKVAFLKR